jgi:hypothetical protein
VIDPRLTQSIGLFQFVLSQPHLRNMASGVLRGTIGYGSPAIARVWIDK